MSVRLRWTGQLTTLWISPSSPDYVRPHPSGSCLRLPCPMNTPSAESSAAVPARSCDIADPADAADVSYAAACFEQPALRTRCPSLDLLRRRARPDRNASS